MCLVPVTAVILHFLSIFLFLWTTDITEPQSRSRQPPRGLSFDIFPKYLPLLLALLANKDNGRFFGPTCACRSWNYRVLDHLHRRFENADITYKMLSLNVFHPSSGSRAAMSLSSHTWLPPLTLPVALPTLTAIFWFIILSAAFHKGIRERIVSIVFVWPFFTRRYDFLVSNFAKTGRNFFSFKVMQVRLV